MALTGQDVLNQLNKVTLPQMLAGIGVAVAALTVANFFLEIQPTLEQIERRQAERVRLEKELIDKQAIANNLDQSKRDMAVLERRLAQALTELPNEANIDELIRSLSEIGSKSGLTILTIDDRRSALTSKASAAIFPKRFVQSLPRRLKIVTAPSVICT